MTPTETLQAAIDAARDLAVAARTGAPPDQLDDLAGRVVQLTGAFRAALRTITIHWEVVCDELGYVGPACLAEGGELTDDLMKVTCSKCRAEADRLPPP